MLHPEISNSSSRLPDKRRIDLRRKYKRRQPVVAAIYFCISVPVASRKVERRKRRSGAPEISHIAERIHIQHCKVRAVTAIKVHHLSRPIDALQAAAIGNSQLPNLDIPLHLQPFEREFTEFHTRQLGFGQCQFSQRHVGQGQIHQLMAAAQIERGEIYVVQRKRYKQIRVPEHNLRDPTVSDR